MKFLKDLMKKYDKKLKVKSQECGCCCSKKKED